MTATPVEMFHRDIKEWMHENDFDPQSLDNLIYEDKKSGYKVMNTRQREEAQLFIIRFDKLLPAVEFTTTDKITESLERTQTKVTDNVKQLLIRLYDKAVNNDVDGYIKELNQFRRPKQSDDVQGNE